MISITVEPNKHPIEAWSMSNRESTEKEINDAIDFLAKYKEEINTRRTVIQDLNVESVTWRSDIYDSNRD